MAKSGTTFDSMRTDVRGLWAGVRVADDAVSNGHADISRGESRRPSDEAEDRSGPRAGNVRAGADARSGRADSRHHEYGDRRRHRQRGYDAGQGRGNSERR